MERSQIEHIEQRLLRERTRALRSLGRNGVGDLVDRCCDLAIQMAGRLRDEAGIRILNDVVLNQVLVKFESADGTNVTPEVIARVQRAGVCWAGGTRWMDEPAMRISVSGWRTTPADIERSAVSIIECHRQAIVDGPG